MINVSKVRKEAATDKKTDCIYLFFWCAVIFLLLFLRDANSVTINKNIFTLIVCICALTMKTKNLIYLFCFLFPLYVGLPGNYLTLILVARLLADFSNIKIKVSAFILTILTSVFIFAQNIVTGFVGISQMMFIAGLAVVLLIFSHKEKLNAITIIVLYSVGVAALGFIMLISTLNNFELADLLSSSFRLGTSNADYAGEGVMNVSVDPNFYGVFTISSVATVVPILFNVKLKRTLKFFLFICSFLSITIAFIGLSRAFFAIFIVWMFLYLLSQKNVKGTLVMIVFIAATVIVLVFALPQVFESIIIRFNESDMATGNGRIPLVSKFFELWSENILSILFGVGLFNCNVHCTPLQFLFGGGIVLFLLMSGLFFAYMNAMSKKTSRFGGLPLLATFAMMCTAPAAGLLNYMFPLVFHGLVAKALNYNNFME